MIISLYHSTDCLLNLAILVLPYMPNGPNIITVAASILTTSTAFGGIIYFIINFVFYYNRGSECVTQQGTGYL